VDPVLSDTEIKSTMHTYEELLKNENASIVHVDEMGLRQLAYPIKKRTTGVYYSIEYASETGAVIPKMELALRRDERIMRFLTISLDRYGVKYNDDKRNGLIGKKKSSEETPKEEPAKSTAPKAESPKKEEVKAEAAKVEPAKEAAPEAKAEAPKVEPAKEAAPEAKAEGTTEPVEVKSAEPAATEPVAETPAQPEAEKSAAPVVAAAPVAAAAVIESAKTVINNEEE